MDVRLVFLAHVNDPATTPRFPGDPAFTLETVATIAGDGYHLQAVAEGEHTGTHWGTPAHFRADGAAADDLAPEDLFLPAVCLDARAVCARDPDHAVTAADLAAFERRHGPIPAEAAVILWTGWDGRWGTPAYANLDGAGTLHQPGFAVEAVEWLIDRGCLGERGALGTDTFGPDRGVDSTYAVSRLLYDRHRISLECLANLDALPPTGAHVLVGGPRNRGGSGSTATIYGVIPI